jgi:glucan phosphoethanolaminetransferase (alkaline phosphatase superfamily)
VITNYKAPVLPVYILSWLMPGLLFLAVDYSKESATKLLFTLVFLCAWHLAFKDFLRSVYYSLFFFFLLPFDLFFFYIYREPPGSPVLLSIVDTNMVEAADFMRGRGLILFCAVVFAIAVWLLTVKAAQQGMGRDWKWYNRTSRRLARTLLFVFGAWWLFFTTAPVIEKTLQGAGREEMAAGIARTDEQVGAPLGKLQAIFPIGRLVSLGEYYREEAHLRYAEQRKARFRYHARQVDTPATRQIYVLVIGETARADHFQLNGYAREPAPMFLAGQENLVPLTNILTPWTFTRLAVPVMLTPVPSRPNAGRNHTRSIVSAFREAGFRSYWISNQQPVGMRETEVSHYAREADEAIFLNVSMRAMHSDGHYDEKLLVPLESFLRRRESKQFFVLHLLGSHDGYEKRYPPGFDFFKPSLRSLADSDHHDRRNKREVLNSYDNAMRYTDFVLSKLIEALKKEHAVSTLIYAADHGETLFDGECQRSGHGSSGKQEFPVAAMVWVSNEHKAHWPAKFAQLSAHSSAPITTESILPTALDLAAIVTDRPDRSRSLASREFRAQRRWVNAPDLLDWDAAATKGSCNLLVPK